MEYLSETLCDCAMSRDTDEVRDCSRLNHKTDFHTSVTETL